MAGKLENRLAKIEHVLAKKARQKLLANCHCRDEEEVFFGDDARLEAELNLTCPVHKERRLVRLLSSVIAPKGRAVPNPRRDALVEEYERRRARQLEQRLEDDSEEL
jgi:hypothetical protein